MIRASFTLVPLIFTAVFLEGCTGGEVRTLSEKIDRLTKEQTERANALEARTQHLDNRLSQQIDLTTRIVGKWSGVSIRSDGSGSFRETQGIEIGFNGDGSLTGVKIPGLGAAGRYRVINSNIILFTAHGGTQRLASNATLEDNRLSFLLEGTPPLPVLLTRR